MERSAANGAAGQKNRFELSHGRERTRAPDLDRNSFQQSNRLLGGILVSDCPARRFGGETDFLPLRKTVQLDHRTVCLIGELAADLIQFLNRLNELVDRLAVPGFLRRFESKRFKPGQRLGLRLRRILSVLDSTGSIDDNVQRPLGQHPRIKLFKRPRCRITRISKAFLPSRLAFRIQLLEPGLSEVNLAANLEQLRARALSSTFVAARAARPRMQLRG